MIDDDPAVRDLMSRFLTKLGFNVVAARQRRRRLAACQASSPGTYHAGCRYAGLRWVDVLSKLKADPELAKIPVIMVTVVDNEAMGFDLGASNYLIKPVDRDRLAVLIEKHRVARSTAMTASNAVSVSPTSQRPEARRSRR